MTAPALTLTVETPEQMEGLGARIAAHLQAGDLVLLNGDLGAGKTTLARGIGEGLDVRGAITSPTFVLARTHPRGAGLPPLVHVDAYRLGAAIELDDLDIDFDRSIVVVEWGAGMLDAGDALQLDLERPRGGAPDSEAEPRTITIAARSPRWEGVLRDVAGH